MAWRAADFKGQRVWAEVDQEGALVTARGTVSIRYQKRPGAKLYRAGIKNVAVVEGSSVEELPDAEPAEPIENSSTSKPLAPKTSRGSGFGSAGTRSASQAALALDAAKKLVDDLTAQGAILCFTDGAAKGNPGPAGSGAVVMLPDGRQGEGCLSLGHGTNNQGELSAIGLALDLLDDVFVSRSAKIAVFTDSSYAHGVLAKNWKAKANPELIADLRQRLAEFTDLELFWIAGHVGLPGNERADVLANEGVDGLSGRRWA